MLCPILSPLETLFLPICLAHSPFSPVYTPEVSVLFSASPYVLVHFLLL